METEWAVLLSVALTIAAAGAVAAMCLDGLKKKKKDKEPVLAGMDSATAGVYGNRTSVQPSASVERIISERKSARAGQDRDLEVGQIKIDIQDASSAPGSSRTGARPLVDRLSRLKKKPDLSQAARDLSQKYEIGDVLGRGAFSVVRQCTLRETGEVRAMKAIKKKKAGDTSLILREVDIMRSIEHPHIIKLEDMFEDDQYLWLVMEYASGGELFDVLVEEGAYSEARAAELITKMINAVQYLHQNGVVHRDIKPENLLLASPETRTEIKISDFGLSRIFQFNAEGEPQPNKNGQIGRLRPAIRCNTFCGTEGYMAPEMLRGMSYTEAVDVWSTGVMLYILLCGYPPFNYDDRKSVMSGRYSFPSPAWDSVSDDAKDLVRQFLQVDPKKRITFDQALQHKWLSPGEASTEPLPCFHDNFAEFWRKRRFRVGADVAIAVHRFRVSSLDPEKFTNPIEEHYTLSRVLGRGAASVVRVGKHKKTGKEYAIKTLNRRKMQMQVTPQLMAEVGILKRVQHPKIIRLEQAYKTSKHIHIVMELARGGELLDVITNHDWYSEEHARGWVKDMLEALAYLHSMGIVHRDMKPENLLLAEPPSDVPPPSPGSSPSVPIKPPTDMHVMLSDFGLARMAVAELSDPNRPKIRCKTFCGTEGYVAPEIIRKEDYGVEVDLWSAGVITFILLFGYPPFDYTEPLQGVTQPLAFPENTMISANAIDLVRKMLVVDPETRISAAEALKHPWITNEASHDVCDETLNNMREFAAKRKLKAGVAVAIAVYRMSGDAKNRTSVDNRNSDAPAPSPAALAESAEDEDDTGSSLSYDDSDSDSDSDDEVALLDK